MNALNSLESESATTAVVEQSPEETQRCRDQLIAQLQAALADQLLPTLRRGSAEATAEPQLRAACSPKPASAAIRLLAP